MNSRDAGRHEDDLRAGHCGHSKCANLGDPDERDPLGCCNCGTRLREAASDVFSALEALVAGVEDCDLSQLAPLIRAEVLVARLHRARAAIRKARGQ